MTTSLTRTREAPEKRNDPDPSSGLRAGRPSRRWAALIVLGLAQLMVILDSTIVNIALPTAQADLGFSADSRQWVVTGYALAFGGLLLLGGRLSDSFGRRNVFILGIAGFAVASAVAGAAGGLPMLLTARAAQGAFAALLAPAALALLSVTFPEGDEGRDRAFGIFGAISGAGGALGLLLGGVLAQHVSWRWCLYVNVPLAGLALAGAAVLLPRSTRSTRPTRARLDVGGTATAVLGLVGIVFGLSNAAAAGWTAPLTLAPVAGGFLLMVVFVLLEQRASQPLLPLGVVRDRTRGTAFLAVGISGIGSFAVFLFLTYYLEQTLHFTPVRTGLAFVPMVACLMAGAVVSGGILLPRVGPRPLVPVGALLAAAGMATLTRIGLTSSYAGAVLPALILVGLGLGFIFGPAQNAATSGVLVDESGAAAAMVNTTQQIGGSIGLALFSSLSAFGLRRHLEDPGLATPHTRDVAAATVASYHLVFWCAAALLVATAALSAALFRSGPLSGRRPAAHPSSR